MTNKKKDTKKYHDWVYRADDQINQFPEWIINQSESLRKRKLIKISIPNINVI